MRHTLRCSCKCAEGYKNKRVVGDFACLVCAKCAQEYERKGDSEVVSAAVLSSEFDPTPLPPFCVSIRSKGISSGVPGVVLGLRWEMIERDFRTRTAGAAAVPCAGKRFCPWLQCVR